MFTRLALALSAPRSLSPRATPHYNAKILPYVLCAKILIRHSNTRSNTHSNYRRCLNRGHRLSSQVDTTVAHRCARTSYLVAGIYYSQFHERSKLRLSACERQPQSVQSYPYGHVQ